MIYFADTNFFLECRSLHCLDWKQITNDKMIELYICFPVIQEIDKHKNNPQKKRKTKKIQTLLMDLIQNNKQKEFELPNDIHLIIKIADKYKLSDLKTVEGLDLELKDDEIISTVYLFNKNMNNSAILLTHDYGMLLKAESFIDVCFIPEDWLASEKDEVQKENERLKAEILKLSKKEPRINCKIYIGNLLLENNTKKTLNFTLFEKITESQIYYYEFQMESHCPRVMNFNISALEKQINKGLHYEKPSQSKIDDYHKKYNEWIEHQLFVLQTFIKKHNECFLICPVRIELENTGTVPAESFEIEVFSNMGSFFATDNLDKYREDHLYHFHAVPEAPKGEFKASSYLSLNLLNSNNEPVPPILNRDLFPEFRHEETRDKFTFYPSYEDGKLKILCEEMQHQKDKYVMESYFLIDEDKLKNNKITFSYHIYAKNITKPMTITNEINLNINRISAIELIEDELKEKDCI